MREVEIRIKLSEIRESLDSIAEVLPEDFDEFASLGLVKDGLYKRLEFCIENIFDTCAIINSDMNLGIPEEDETIIANLVKGKILEQEWIDRLRGMKAFRNIMVHRYGKIDDRIAFSLLRERMEDFDLFIERIEFFLNNP